MVEVDEVPVLQLRDGELQVGAAVVAALGEGQVGGAAAGPVGAADAQGLGGLLAVAQVVLDLQILLDGRRRGARIAPLAVVAEQVDQVEDVGVAVAHGVGPDGVAGAVGGGVLARDLGLVAGGAQLGAVEEVLVAGDDVVVRLLPGLELGGHGLVLVEEVLGVEHVVVRAHLEVVRAVGGEHGVRQLHRGGVEDRVGVGGALRGIGPVHVGGGDVRLAAGGRALLLQVLLDLGVVLEVRPQLGVEVVGAGLGEFAVAVAVDGVEADGVTARGQGGAGLVGELGEAVRPVDLVAVLVVLLRPVADLVQVGAVEAHRGDRVLVLVDDVVLPAGVLRVHQVQDLPGQHLVLPGVGAVGLAEQPPVGADLGLVVVVERRVRHLVRQRGEAAIVSGVDVVAYGRGADGVAVPGRPGVGDARALVFDGLLVLPQPVVVLQRVDVVALRQLGDVALGLVRRDARAVEGQESEAGEAGPGAGYVDRGLGTAVAGVDLDEVAAVVRARRLHLPFRLPTGRFHGGLVDDVAEVGQLEGDRAVAVHLRRHRGRLARRVAGGVRPRVGDRRRRRRVGQQYESRAGQEQAAERGSSPKVSLSSAITFMSCTCH
nr:hypothetical protein [Streptomyces coryli]